MDIKEFRQKYPQYNDLSDEQLAKGLHKKYYSDMPFDKFSSKFGYSVKSEQPQKQNRGSIIEFISEAGKGARDALTMAERAASGFTLGGTDWLGDKLGLGTTERKKRIEDEYGSLGKLANIGAETTGNLVGAGGALLKGGSKLGLKGLGLASGTGAVEGAVYGATGSDSLKELPANMLIGSTIGAVTPYAVNTAVKPIVLAKNSNILKQYSDKTIELLNKSKIGNKYNRLLKNPYEGESTDIIASMGREQPTTLLRGEAIPGADGKPIVSGRQLLQTTGTERNYGLNKAIYKHNITKAEAKKIPSILRKYVPVEVTERGQMVYAINDGKKNPLVVVTSPINGKQTVSSVYRETRNPDRALSGFKFPQSRGLAYQAKTHGYAAGDSSFVPAGGEPINNVTHKEVNVKPYLKRSFIEALVDKNDRRTMKNAVKSGADDLSENASILGEMLSRRKEGMFDKELEDAIITPQLKLAHESYQQFMSLNGSKKIPQKQINKFYNENPVAQDMIEGMRTVDPQSFKGVKPGSFAEFDVLKRALREQSSNMTAEVNRKSGVKNAEKSLKDLMEKNFKGFKDVNKQYAEAQTAQDLFESKLKKGYIDKK